MILVRMWCDHADGMIAGAEASAMTACEGTASTSLLSLVSIHILKRYIY